MGGSIIDFPFLYKCFDMNSTTYTIYIFELKSYCSEISICAEEDFYLLSFYFLLIFFFASDGSRNHENRNSTLLFFWSIAWSHFSSIVFYFIQFVIVLPGYKKRGIDSHAQVLLFNLEKNFLVNCSCVTTHLYYSSICLNYKIFYCIHYKLWTNDNASSQVYAIITRRINCVPITNLSH